MRAVIQRVLRAEVIINGTERREIPAGFVALLGVKNGDGEQEAELLAKKTAELRILCDDEGKMNRSLLDYGQSILVISNFTLYANCSHGRRPEFLSAAKPPLAERLYEYFVEQLRARGVPEVKTGEFGAHMELRLVNNGPVTILLDTDELKGRKA